MQLDCNKIENTRNYKIHICIRNKPDATTAYYLNKQNMLIIIQL